VKSSEGPKVPQVYTKMELFEVASGEDVGRGMKTNTPTSPTCMTEKCTTTTTLYVTISDL